MATEEKTIERDLNRLAEAGLETLDLYRNLSERVLNQQLDIIKLEQKVKALRFAVRVILLTFIALTLIQIFL